MKPALSVVAFTVLSGAGLGALALLAFADIASVLRVAAVTASPFVIERGGMLALAMVVAGLCASTLHLGNPRNAWRSLSRLRTSWLSREAAAALALLAVATSWVMIRDGPVPIRVMLDVAVVLLAWLTLHCTAMIYASLKPIRHWHTSRVPLGYLALGHASGALLVVAMFRVLGEPAFGFSIVAGALLAVAAALKLDYYAFIAGDEGRISLEQAIGVPQGVAPAGARGTRMRARLFDLGHSRGTFLTEEFGYTLAPRRRTTLRVTVWIAGFALPAVWLASGATSWPLAVLAVASCLGGLGAERWLFFAEARHTVRLYHGDRST